MAGTTVGGEPYTGVEKYAGTGAPTAGAAAPTGVGAPGIGPTGERETYGGPAISPAGVGAGGQPPLKQGEVPPSGVGPGTAAGIGAPAGGMAPPVHREGLLEGTLPQGVRRLSRVQTQSL